MLTPCSFPLFYSSQFSQLPYVVPGEKFRWWEEKFCNNHHGTCWPPFSPRNEVRHHWAPSLSAPMYPSLSPAKIIVHSGRSHWLIEWLTDCGNNREPAPIMATHRCKLNYLGNPVSFTRPFSQWCRLFLHCPRSPRSGKNVRKMRELEVRWCGGGT